MPAVGHPNRLQTRAQHIRSTYPLPNLNATTYDLTAKLVRIKVLNRPRLHTGEGTTWTVDEEPTSPLHIGKLVILYNDHGESGIGRISSVTDLRQHWVTFTLGGAEHPAHLRIPVVWSRLDDLAAYTFSTYFHSLPPYPEPPVAARRKVHESANREQSPTRWEALHRLGDVGDRITKITRGSRRGQD